LASFQMDMVAQGWLVYELTGSALALGWVAAGRSIAMLLFSLYGGVISDRVEKRDVLVWTRCARTLIHLGLTLLIATGAVRVWHVAAASVLSGIFIALVMPAERAIIPELVDQRALLNAISLSSVARGLMAILAAWMAGFLIEIMGVAGAYCVIVAFHLLTLLIVSRLPATGRRESLSHSVWHDFKEALRYIIHRPVLMALLGLALSTALFSRSYRTFMPKFAAEVMGFEAAGFGLLMSAPGMGSLIGSLVVASLGNFRGKGKLLLAAGVTLGVSLLLFANIHSFLPVLLFLALVGAASNTCIVTNDTLLQANSESEFRGRVISVYLTMWGLTPLGTLPAGAIADRLGVPFAISLQGALLIVTFLGMMFLQPKVRQLK